jgi:hypothetical protein
MNQKLLHYYCFDADDNLLRMNTKIHMDKLQEDGTWKPHSVSTGEFALVRNDKVNWRCLDNSPEKAFADFRDTGTLGSDAFFIAAHEAYINKRFAPSWDAFIQCLVNGSIFAICTARGHEPDSMKKFFQWLIHNHLTPEQQNEMKRNLIEFHYHFTEGPTSTDFEYLINAYLDSCKFYGVTSSSFVQENKDAGACPLNPEKGKEIAIHNFVKIIDEYGKKAHTVSLGFSDDDVRNVNHIHKFMKEHLSSKYRMKFNVYDTSNPDLIGGVRIKVNH